MKIGIGIDTGGTYTDAVAYDFDTGTLLAKGKTLTTRENLSVGIGNALNALPPEMVRDTRLIALSTTLATNACVENKGGRAKLLVFGLTDELLVRYGADVKYGFKRENVRCIETDGSSDGLVDTERDWEEIMAGVEPFVADADAVAIAELYSMSNGAPCEKHAKQLVEDRMGLICVGASELSSDLDVLERGATALLNARLFPIGREFIDAALKDFAERKCEAPVMVVRSDGSLMSADLTRTRPVETILSGPAASVLAGKSFTDRDDYLIIDMGGTTTDVSAVRGGKPAMADNGIRIGGWRTHVKGVFIDTFALGGDSTVRMEGGAARLFPRRAMPICMAASRWPDVVPMLRDLLHKKHTNLFPLHELFYLVHEPADLGRYGSYEIRLIDELRNGPCLLGKIRESKDIDIYHLNTERLEAEGIIMRCGLTPTDFMHIRGDYRGYDAEASELAARFLLMTLKRKDSPEELLALANEVCSLVEGRLYENLVRILLMQQYPDVFADGVDAQTGLLIREAWARHCAGAGGAGGVGGAGSGAGDAGGGSGRSGTGLGSGTGGVGVGSSVGGGLAVAGTGTGRGYFDHMFSTSAALVGVGAPTHVFLPNVAAALGTECILPEHAEVANAIGALKADINVVFRVDVSQRLSLSEGIYYIVHAPDGSLKFKDLDLAMEAASKAAEAAALKEARVRGALGQLNANTYAERHSTVDNLGGNVNMGGAVVSEVTARFES
ncbi:MAG: hypothetical protein FWH33_08570 [Oscillospiraceae bacterium]|nr:hypothetical protein [Oscillospiraceae bacterium]